MEPIVANNTLKHFQKKYSLCDENVNLQLHSFDFVTQSAKTRGEFEVFRYLVQEAAAGSTQLSALR
jgi:hypothetical protein